MLPGPEDDRDEDTDDGGDDGGDDLDTYRDAAADREGNERTDWDSDDQESEK